MKGMCYAIKKATIYEHNTVTMSVHCISLTIQQLLSQPQAVQMCWRNENKWIDEWYLSHINKYWYQLSDKWLTLGKLQSIFSIVLLLETLSKNILLWSYSNFFFQIFLFQDVWKLYEIYNFNHRYKCCW